jgi:hypothetical protein
MSIITVVAAVPANAHELGFAGLLSKGNMQELPGIKLSIGEPLGEDMVLKSGTGYELEITADGSGEIQLAGPGFFRAIWVNEVVINDLEIRPYGLESLEFDDEGTMEIEFIAIKPGQYELRIPGTTSDNQRIKITIE